MSKYQLLSIFCLCQRLFFIQTKILSDVNNSNLTHVKFSRASKSNQQEYDIISQMCFIYHTNFKHIFVLLVEMDLKINSINSIYY